MKKFHARLRFLTMIIMLSSFLQVAACSQDRDTEKETTNRSGQVSFKATYRSNGDRVQRSAAKIDCSGLNVTDVEAAVYGPGKTLLVNGGPWECDGGKGVIDSVPAGSNRTLVILGKNSEGKIVFHGERIDLEIPANTPTEAGDIACHPFTPNLQTPTNTSVVSVSNLELGWNAVQGAVRYNLIVAEDEMLNNRVIDMVTPMTIINPTELVDGKIYYWQVFAYDKFDNVGIGSPIWSYTTDAQNVNAAPTATITGPASGTAFTDSDSIPFTGTGRDEEEGRIRENALTWSSDINGQIGVGESFSADALDAGTHQITLTAVDSKGAKGSDTITITITSDPTNTPPVAQISSPKPSSEYTTGDTIEFSGIGSDDEDGFLSGDSLVWRSSINGQFGTGNTFSTDTLSAGTHQITLTVTDTKGAARTASIDITVISLGPHGITTLDAEGDVGKYSSITAEDGHIYIAYQDQSKSDLKLLKSVDDGLSWTPIDVSSSQSSGEAASIAKKGDKIFISSSMGFRPPMPPEITLLKYKESDNTWNEPQISGSETLDLDCSDNGDWSTSTALDYNDIYISYLSVDDRRFYVLKSTDTLDDWTMKEIPPPPGESKAGKYASMDATHYLIISHAGDKTGNIYLTIGYDSPITLLVDEIGVPGGGAFTACKGQSAAELDMVWIYNYVAYFDPSDGNRCLKFARTMGDGPKFFKTTIDDSSPVVGTYPSITSNNQSIFISYHDETKGNLKIARSTDHGDTWETDTVDNSTENVGRYSSIAVDGPKVYISYYDDTNKNLKFAKSIDGGKTWR